MNVCFITDNIAGHLNQLRGLEQALKSQCDLHSTWLSIEHGWQPIWDYWSNPGVIPDWIIGVGRATHIPMLLLKWRHKVPVISLNRPHWPLFLFDLLVVPRHDGIGRRNNVIDTEGSLNTVQPAQQADRLAGLILIGGPSIHYDWDQAAVLEQVEAVVKRHPDIHWTLSTSRRTPTEFLPALKSLGLEPLECLAVEETAPGWVAAQLQCCATAWVSEDSVSMVYEALSAGARVGLINLPRVRQGRVAAGIDALVERNKLTTYKDFIEHGYRSPEQPEPLQEAMRIARKLVEKS